MKHETLTFRFLDMSRGGFARLFLLFLLPCLSVIGVKAADSNGGVKVTFNPDVRYSQWAINSRLHDFYGNQKKFGFDYYDNNGTLTKEVTWLKDGKTYQRTFDYVAGLVGKASLEAADFYENFDWSKPWFYAAQGYATDTRYANTDMTLDNMNAAKMYFPILAGKLMSPDAETAATTAISDVIGHMKTYNSTYVIGSGKSTLNSTNANDVQKTMFGGWFHKSSGYTDQMWCDGQYMGPALLAQIIKHTGKTNNISDNDWDIIAKQFSITWAQLYNKTTGLLYHGFTANPGDNASSSWAGISKENGIYHSASFWGRANAWYFLALVDILEVMPTNNTYYDTFKGYLTSLAAGIKKYQDETTGCWYQVMDKVPASLTGNYLEASCSSIFTAGYLKAIRLGLLDKTTYEPIAKKAYEGLVNQFMVYDNTDNSTIQLVHSCTSAGLGGDSKRAGDDNYYLTGTDASVVTSSDPTNKYYYTEGKVLGGFIMAATEYERAYQNQDSKQILFAKDLAPSYNFTTTEGKLDATAYGDGTVTYQWYKSDGTGITKITNATSATYTPTESGEYYCIAKSGNTNITTSKTNVTAKTNSNTDNGGTDNNGGSENGETTTIFSLSVNSGANASVEKQSELSLAKYATISGGSVYVYNGKNTAQSMIVNGSITYTDKSSQYVKITLDKALAKGDVITIATTGTKIYATKDNNSSNTTNNIATSPYTVDDNLAGATVLYLRSGDIGKTISSITITRTSSTPSTPKTDLTATYAEGTLSVVANEVALTTPKLTVTAGGTPLEEGTDYSVTYASNNTNAVSVSTDGKKLSSVNKGGSAIITATITPVDKSKYNATTAQFTINVTGRQLVPAFSSASVSANEGDEPRVLPTLTVKDKISGQDMTDYTVTYASKDESIAKVVDGKLTFVGIGKTTITATITPNKETIYDGCTCSFDVSVAKKEDVNPSATTVVYDFLTNIGEQETTNTSITIGTSNIMLGTNFKQGENKYITITPAGDGGFHAGDIVTIKGYCPKATSGILLYANLTDGEPQYQSPAFPATEKEYTFIVQADCDALYLGRFGGSTTYITSLKITRPGVTGNKTRLTAAFAEHSKVVINKTDNYTMSLPQLTVKAGDNAFDAYTVAYTSNDEGIASVATNGEITIKSTGTVTILATITPTDKDNYEGCTATYTITVKNATPLTITTNDVNINVTDAQIKQPAIKVYGDNDKLLTLGTDYTLSFTIEGSNVTENNGVFTVTGDPYKWTEGTSTITVTAKPTESLSELFTESTFTFTYNVVKGKLTPAFLNNFATETIKVKKYDKSLNNSKSFTVPLIYDGENVSEYFKYTYEIDGQDATKVNTNNKVVGSKLTLRPDLSEGEHTIKVTAVPKSSNNDKDNYADVYNAPTDITFKIYVSASYIIPIVKFNPENVTMYTGTTEGAPDVLVTTDGTNKIDENTYTTKWVSFTPSFVKVDMTTGNLEAVNEGTGSVRVTVKGDNLETTTAFLTVYVDDPALYRAKEKENDGTAVTYGNQKIMWNQNKTMQVTLGGWMFPTVKVDTPDYSDEGLSSTYQWANTATQPKWKMAGFDRYVSGESSKNARQENGSNAMPNSIKISKADFKTNAKTIRDKMFNVPCSGSYLVFNPATTGTVTVHIFQNGAFDTSNGKSSYRPQRRVFVMDEEGNFVQSTASIANANGKPTGGIKSVSSYMWDINPNGANTAPTLEQVRSHFKNLPTDFDMTPEKFQNNIYESNLTKDVAPNDAYDEKVPGSNGWCVLADSPVTYTFSVKPGKTYYLYNFGSKIGFYGFSFDEDETKPIVDVKEYDAETANVNNVVEKTPDGHVAQVKIARKMVANRWTTCVLPFSLNVHQVDAIFGDTYKSGCENGTQILYFDRVEGNKAYFVRHAYNTIVAGKPFLIKPTKDVESINTADVTDYPYVTIENTEPNEWCESNGYVWTSSYNTMNIVKNDYFIGASDGNFKAYAAASGTVKGFRGFLKAKLPAGAKPMMLSISTSSITDGNEGETTGIEDLIITADGELMPANSRVYNVNGQLVSEDANTFQSLPSGIYIINGKKYIK